MKKVIITGARRAELVEVPTPQATGHWVLVKIHVAPMCTEYKTYVSGGPADSLGHEAAGEVVGVDLPGPVRVGDRVVVMPGNACGACALCHAGDYIHCEHTLNPDSVQPAGVGSGTYAQYILKPSHLLMKIPDGVSYEMASLACCALGPSFNALNAMNLRAYDTLLITGMGPVGMGGLVNARFLGARVVCVDPLAYAREKALELGAEAAFDSEDPDVLAKVRAACGGTGPDCALDCSGESQAHRLCIDAVRRMGQVSFVGENYGDTSVSVSPDLLRKGIKLIGVWHYNYNLYPELMKVIRRSPIVERLITHVLPMSEAARALEISASHQRIKMLLKPWE